MKKESRLEILQKISDKSNKNFQFFNFTIFNHLAYSAKAALATKARQ